MSFQHKKIVGVFYISTILLASFSASREIFDVLSERVAFFLTRTND